MNEDNPVGGPDGLEGAIISMDHVREGMIIDIVTIVRGEVVSVRRNDGDAGSAGTYEDWRVCLDRGDGHARERFVKADDQIRCIREPEHDPDEITALSDVLTYALDPHGDSRRNARRLLATGRIRLTEGG